jgi:hypothetical protein
LTPSHFLLGKGSISNVQVTEDYANLSISSFSEREQDRLITLNKFWEIWSEEYLRNLPSAIPKFQNQGQIKMGSLVLIREDNTPRMHWLIGVIERVHQGRDGVVRSADIRTSKGLRTRAIQRIHLLETFDMDDVVPLNVQSDSSGEVQNKRSSRKVTKPKYLNDYVP